MDRLTAQGQVFGTMARAMYVDRCTIRQRTNTKTASGANLPGVNVIASDVPIKIRPASADEKEVAGALQGSTAFSVSIPSWQGQTVTELDSTCSLEIAARAEGKVEAQTLQVVAPLPSSSSKLKAVAVRQS